MKRFLLPLLLCTPALAPAQTPADPVAPAPAAAAPVLTPEQTASIMKQLEQIEGQIVKGKSELFSAALSKFRAAVGSKNTALALYLDCYKIENYDRRNLKTSDFQDWKDANETRLKDDDFLDGLVLQLEYLILTVQAQDIKEIKDMGSGVTALQAFIPRAIGAVQATMKHTASGAVEEKDRGGNGNRPGPGGRRPGGGGGGGGGGQLEGILRASIRDTVFARATQIDQYLRNPEWEYSPLNIPGLYNNVILPYYLSEKPAEIPAQYDARINAEMALRKISMSEAQYAEFYKEQYPEFLWAKANFMYQQKINPINALADMLKIVRENPSHARAADWLKQLRQAVNGTQPEVVESPGAGPAAGGPRAAAAP